MDSNASSADKSLDAREADNISVDELSQNQDTPVHYNKIRFLSYLLSCNFCKIRINPSPNNNN